MLTNSILPVTPDAERAQPTVKCWHAAAPVALTKRWFRDEYGRLSWLNALIQVREALRRCFVDERIVVTPVAEGYYVAEGRFLPLVALVDPALDLAPGGATVLVVLR